MVTRHIPPTKSNLLKAKKQLAFAREGYELLDQKRQILVIELMGRMRKSKELNAKAAEALVRALSALRDAELDIGSAAVERLAGSARVDYELSTHTQRLMGLSLPRLHFKVTATAIPFSLGTTSMNLDRARTLFIEILPLIAELAELAAAIKRITAELRKTTRRCNVLSKIFIPDFEATITAISSSLEERDRESFVILKMIRNRLTRDQGEEDGGAQPPG
jgi:V/A-type H+-transporting ATPase subunit D